MKPLGTFGPNSRKIIEGRKKEALEGCRRCGIKGHDEMCKEKVCVDALKKKTQQLEKALQDIIKHQETICSHNQGILNYSMPYWIAKKALKE